MIHLYKSEDEAGFLGYFALLKKNNKDGKFFFNVAMYTW